MPSELREPTVDVQTVSEAPGLPRRFGLDRLTNPLVLQCHEREVCPGVQPLERHGLALGPPARRTELLLVGLYRPRLAFTGNPPCQPRRRSGSGGSVADHLDHLREPPQASLPRLLLLHRFQN